MKLALTLALLVVATATLVAQRPGINRRESSSIESYGGNVRYDGRFVFVRMSYQTNFRREPPWAHDYNVGETHFLKIFTGITNVAAHVDYSSVMAFNDPLLMKFPVAYLVEPGYWIMSDDDVKNLRAYLQKGGFLIVDDFPQVSRIGGGIDSWANFEQQMARCFPDGRWIKLDPTHPIFHSFFDIDDFSSIPTAYNLGGRPEFWALFEDNDPNKRMFVIANYMNDISEFWEHSEKGYYMVADTNQAYKFGVNEFLYGMTH
jgi:hypothetical protein